MSNDDWNEENFDETVITGGDTTSLNLGDAFTTKRLDISQLRENIQDRKRLLVDDTFLRMGFEKGKRFTFNDLMASGASGVFKEDWEDLKLKLTHNDIDALSSMFRVQTYINTERRTILVNPEALSGSDTSIWGVLSLTEHAILADLTRDTFFKESLEVMEEKSPDPVVDLSRAYRLINLLDLQKIDAAKQAISIPDLDLEIEVPGEGERYTAALLMSRLYSRTGTLAPNEQVRKGFENFYSGRRMGNIRVFTDESAWVSYLAE